MQESIERTIELLRARIEAKQHTWPTGRPSRYYDHNDDDPGEPKGDRNYPDGDRPGPYGGDYEGESDDEDDSDSEAEDDSDGAGAPEDDSDSDDERRGAEVEAIRNFGLISRDPRQIQELSAVVDNAEMRTIDGEPETQQQRQLARQLAPAIAGTSPFTEDGVYTTDQANRKIPKPLPELMRMARVASLWPVLSDLQKDQYIKTTGVLANDRHYIARNVLIGAPIRKKRPFVINAQSKKIYV